MITNKDIWRNVKLIEQGQPLDIPLRQLKARLSRYYAQKRFRKKNSIKIKLKRKKEKKWHLYTLIYAQKYREKHKKREVED